MLRQVSYPKAVAAGMAGAAAWEAVARSLIFAGIPFVDIVRDLGSVAAPGSADPWLWWALGMTFHLTVGAIWAVFYAYFFFYLFPLRPVWQGLLFALVPMSLAILVVHPQFQLMQVAHSDALSTIDKLGLGNAWMVASIVVAHLIWGAVLGAIYTHPVGYDAAKPPRLLRPRREREPVHAVPSRADDRFIFATGIECSYPTIEGGRWRIDEMDACGHYRQWRDDLALVRELGLRYLRYGPPLHLIFRGRGRYDWAFFDEVAAEMQRLGIIPIIDLCHFGLPTWLGNFQNDEVPAALTEYAAAFATRYPWVRFYTPVNEMYVCAKFSALDGLWNEQLTDEAAFVTAVKHLARANISMMEAIKDRRPDAIFINSESSEFYQACCPDEKVGRIANFENQRRFLPLDLLYAHPVDDGMRRYLFDHGLKPDEYASFMNRAPPEAILGIDYYDWNEKLIDNVGAAEVLGELFGWYVVASQYYDRYRRPMMHTETNYTDAREAPRWLWRQWHNIQLIKASGVPVVGFTWYSLTDQIDWDIALRRAVGNVNPVGLYDLNRDIRPVGQGYAHLIRLFSEEMAKESPLRVILERSRPEPVRRGAVHV